MELCQELAPAVPLAYIGLAPNGGAVLLDRNYRMSSTSSSTPAASPVPRHQLAKRAFSASCPTFVIGDPSNQCSSPTGADAEFTRSDLQQLSRNAFDKRKLAFSSGSSSFDSRRDLVDWMRKNFEIENDVKDIFDICEFSTYIRKLPTTRTTNSVAHGKELLRSLEFDALSYFSDDLVDLCVEIFVELLLHSTLGISRESLKSFVLNVRSQMADNPYHNWFHVVDVAQTIYCLGLQSGIIQLMSDKERLAMLIAALCHDLDHPGVNNSFLIKTRSALASQYGMHVACLEKHHSSRASDLMTNDANDGLLDALPEEDRSEIIGRIQTFILATDMSRHAEYMALLTILVRSCRDGECAASVGPPDESRRQVVAELLMKCADMSNVLKPFPVAKRWAIRVTDEFFKQGDLERSLGMEVSPLCDRRKDSRVAIQKGFIAFIAPFYEAVGELLPALRPAVERLKSTRSMWERYPSDAALLVDLSRQRPLDSSECC